MRYQFFLMIIALLCSSIVHATIVHTVKSVHQDYGYNCSPHYVSSEQENGGFIAGVSDAYLEFDNDWSTLAQPRWLLSPPELQYGAYIQEIYNITNNVANIMLKTKGSGVSNVNYDAGFKIYLYNWNLSVYELLINSSSGSAVNFSIDIDAKYIFDDSDNYIIKEWISGNYYLGLGATQMYESELSYSIDVCQNGICCNYDENPTLSKNIDWKCTTDQNAQCLVGIFWEDTLLTVSPSVADVGNYGRISIMDAKNGILNFRLNTVDLYPEMTYQVHVFCHSNTSASEYIGEITPQYRNMGWLASRFGFVKENLGYLIGFGILLIFVAIIIVIMKVVLP